MTEELWFILLIWVFLLLLSYRTKSIFYTGIASVVSLIFGIVVMVNVYAWLGFALVIIGIYLLYLTFFGTVSKRKAEA